MRLDSLSLTDFGCHADTKVKFGPEPVAVILGPNKSGKSTLAVDSVKFVLRNEARGAAGIAGLVRRGGPTGCKVAAVARPTRDGGPVALHRTTSSGTTQKAILEALGLRSADALDAALEAWKFFYLEPVDRRALAFKSSGAVLDEATLRAAGVTDAEVLKVALAKGKGLGVEAAERLATSKKREKNNEAAAVRRPAPGAAPVVPAGSPSLALLRAQRDRAAEEATTAAHAEDAFTKFVPARAKAAEVLEAARPGLARANELREAAAALEREAAAIADPAVPAGRAQIRPDAERMAEAADLDRQADAVAVVSPDTKAGEAARAAVDAARDAHTQAEWAVRNAGIAVDEAERSLAAGKAAPWARVTELVDGLDAAAQRIETPAVQKVVHGIAAELLGMAGKHGPDLAALESAVKAARDARDAAKAGEAAASATLVEKSAALDAARADWREAGARYSDAILARGELRDRAKAIRDAARQAAEDANNAAAAEHTKATNDYSAALADAEGRRGALRDTVKSKRDEAARLAGAFDTAKAALDALDANAPTKPTTDFAALRERVNDLDRRIVTAEGLERDVAAWKTAKAAHDAGETLAAELEETAATYEAMASALSPDGVIARKSAGPLAEIRKYLWQLAPSVVLTDDWEVQIKNAAASSASRSEQWLAAAALAVAVAAASGVRFTIIDDADVVVDPAERAALIASLVSMREHFDQVLVVCATPPGADTPDYGPLVSTWRCQDGRVQPVVHEAAAA